MTKSELIQRIYNWLQSYRATTGHDPEQIFLTQKDIDLLSIDQPKKIKSLFGIAVIQRTRKHH